MPVSAATRMRMSKQATPPKPQLWWGWWRPAGSSEWRCLAEGADWDSTWRRLLDRLPCQNLEAMVLPAGRTP